MKLKAAAFKNEYGSTILFEIGDFSTPEYFASKGYIQLTEVVEVELPDLTQDKIISNEIRAIEQTIAEERENFMARVELLNSRKQELLALTMQE